MLKRTASGICLGLLAAVVAIPAGAATSQSVYLKAPDDPLAVTVKAVGDGKADDTAAIQATIDQASNKGAGGIVFLPSGRYRITRSLLVRLAVRIYGVGPTRPVLVLAPNTPGFQKGVATMVVFTGGDQYDVGKVPVPVASAVPFSDKNRDANSATFYSALSNVDFEIGDGNPAAAGVRFRTAQHTYLSHIDFHLGNGFAGIYQAGNECDDLHFYGGRYGIVTEKTSPAWQFTLLDSTFEGQRDAAVREHEVDLTLANVTIKKVPVGIEIDRGYSDSLFGKDVRFESVSKAAVIVSNENNAFTQVGFENATARDTPVFALFRDSGKTLKSPGKTYRVKAFTYGLKLDTPGAMGQYDTQYDAAATSSLPVQAAVLKAMPPVAEWANVHDLGAKGDGATDDTAAIQKAIDTHRVVYFPIGLYNVSDTIRLRPDSVVIALHPSLTQLVLPDGLPNYAGVGDAKPLLESASGGNATLSGIGLFTGIVNPRATALMWKAGEQSLVYDVRIHGGHGTNLKGGVVADPTARPRDMDSQFQWDRQRPSIWVRDGGGGTFANVWTPNTFAEAGFVVSNTSTPGHVYELSAEHHVRYEIVLDGVKNWEFLAPQTEEEVRESQDTVSMDIRNSSNILFANYHGYRVTRNIKPAFSAIKLTNSGDLRFRNVHINAESGFATCDDNGCGTYLRASKYPFENAIQDDNRKFLVREREFAVLDVPAGPVTPSPVASAGVEKLATGFYSIAGAAVDASGKLYFIDRRFQRIHAYTEGEGLTTVSDAPVDPINLAVDGSGSLLVLSSFGPEATVYSLDPHKAGAPLQVVKPQAVSDHAGARTLMPVNIWNNGEFRDQLNPDTYEFTTLADMFKRDMGTPKAREYVSPDGSLVLPAFRVWQQGPTTHLGWRFSDTLDTYGFQAKKPGDRVYIVNGSEDLTYVGTVAEGGAVTGLKPFANRGGESVATDAAGNVYVANGQVFVYAPDGTETARIDVPDRPLQLIFGGTDGKTLYILTHHSLYSIRR
ncbi:MAG: SMP-30/gluconolactonase/LRE family protein [Asticcacaulis sp.]|nr:SMP-30/gluconolactonase/LRE family protein [Asticcacaulis sp.]